MPYALIALIAGLFMAAPINKTDQPGPSLVGRYLGTSSFVPEDPTDQPYAETIPLWFVFEDSLYYYAEGTEFPDPDEGGDGGGPYKVTDSTISLDGAYPKILRPVIVLHGLFNYEIHGDTLVMTQSTGNFPGGGRRLHLVRQ